MEQQIICPQCHDCFFINQKKRVREIQEQSIVKKQKALSTKMSMSLEQLIQPFYISPFYISNDICHFIQLPLEMNVLILSYLTEEDYYNARDVCIQWWNICNYFLWKDEADISFPDRNWLHMQPWQQRQMLDRDIYDYQMDGYIAADLQRMMI